jgi:hypothetical protein
MTSSSAAIEKTYFYSAYGLNINSAVPLPELIPAGSGEDVTVRLSNLSDSFLETELKDAVRFERSGFFVRVSTAAIFYHWNGVGRALIRNGSEVIIEPDPSIEKTDLSPFITGTILAVLLHQRGTMVLHSSAVIINGEGVAFLGEKGAGKSTFAAYLQLKGHRLITDDLVAVKFSGGEIETIPGFPRIRLWSDSLESVGLNPEDLPRINKFINKRSLHCSKKFSISPVKLSRLYILSEGDEIEIERLNEKEAFIEIARYTYLSRYLQATGKIKEHFHQCQAVVKSVPVFKLQRPHDFGKLPELASKIENYSLTALGRNK